MIEKLVEIIGIERIDDIPLVLRQNSIRPVFSITSSGRSPFVPVVQSTDFSDLDHCSQIRRLLGSRLRRILCKR
jgi:hypothetical protein